MSRDREKTIEEINALAKSGGVVTILSTEPANDSIEPRESVDVVTSATLKNNIYLHHIPVSPAPKTKKP